MKREMSFIASIVVFIVVSLFVLVNYELVNAQCRPSDHEGPVINIDSSLFNDPVEETLDITGTVTDNCSVKEMIYEFNDQSGTPDATIKKWSFGEPMQIEWDAGTKQLNQGDNSLYIMATDNYGNTSIYETTITYEPETFEGTQGGLVIEKYKSTWYDGEGEDRFSINALIDTNVIPAICGDGSVIKVKLEAQKTDGTYFTMYDLKVDPAKETISCNNYKGKFRYKNRSEKGVYDFRMYEAKGLTKFYLYVVNRNFGFEKNRYKPDRINEYMEFISTLKGIRLSLTIGEETEAVQYSGSIEHDYCSKYEKSNRISKVECHVNR